MPTIYPSLYQNYFDQLVKEIESTPEENIWKISGDVKNSIGHLCMHLCGNLRHFIGGQLGGSGYVRQREMEFNGEALPKTVLLALLDQTRKEVFPVLDSIAESDLKKIFPQLFHEKEWTNEYMLTHMFAHLAYHTGQINYLRRLTNAV